MRATIISLLFLLGTLFIGCSPSEADYPSNEEVEADEMRNTNTENNDTTSSGGSNIDPWNEVGEDDDEIEIFIKPEKE